MIKLDFINQIPDSVELNQIEINNLINDALVKLGKTDNYHLEIWFAREDTVHRLNLKYRGVDRPTDVISFPQSEVDGSKDKLLGSIVISASVVKQKQEDVKDVIKHGLLHLLGFDHEVDEKRWNKAANEIGCKL